MQVPFWAPTEAGIFKQVLQGQLDLHAGPCKGLSQDAKHLMLSLLTRDTKVRPGTPSWCAGLPILYMPHPRFLVKLYGFVRTNHRS